jgi:nucleoside-diphosphate-sugar epimerase
MGLFQHDVKVLVTGSSGRIGGAIAAQLSLRHAVTGIDLLPGALTTESIDVQDTARLAPLLAGVDVVIHTASLHVPDLAARSPAEFRAVNVDATRRLLAAAGEAGIRSFVYTSTTSLYGDAMLPESGAAVWVTEELTPRPRDVYDETKLAAMQLAMTFPMRMQWAYLALPIGAGLMLFHIAVHVIRSPRMHLLDVREKAE